ncbi:response regulator [Alphaproteobacteria bacterium KMM 3653]|uniref:Response regulator n=1 Tax=Harenicola maris TaxID=2841044 RepID=A0AAP2CVP0_9RHOB|nr:response regulator [Harenicola maris]
MTSPPIKTVITIDDEKIDQLLYKRIMERSGLIETVIPFRMAQDALDFLALEDRVTVDAVFVDINMPRMNGFEFLDIAAERFGSDFAKCVVVMLTTSLDPEDQARAEASETINKFLRKPLSIEDLQEVAQLVLNPT